MRGAPHDRRAARARPLASVNVAMASAPRAGGRGSVARRAVERAFGDGEGYRDGDRNDRGVPRGNDYARVLEETLGALQKHARRRFSSPMQ